jgi:peptidoglycan/LPS O-acetylase OafA/YrhL
VRSDTAVVDSVPSRRSSVYPRPSARAIAAWGLGLVALVVGVETSIGRVPPWWALALAVLGLVAMTVGMYVYFQRDVPRHR